MYRKREDLQGNEECYDTKLPLAMLESVKDEEYAMGRYRCISEDIDVHAASKNEQLQSSMSLERMDSGSTSLPRLGHSISSDGSTRIWPPHSLVPSLKKEKPGKAIKKKGIKGKFECPNECEIACEIADNFTEDLASSELVTDETQIPEAFSYAGYHSTMELPALAMAESSCYSTLSLASSVVESPCYAPTSSSCVPSEQDQEPPKEKFVKTKLKHYHRRGLPLIDSAPSPSSLVHVLHVPPFDSESCSLPFIAQPQDSGSVSSRSSLISDLPPPPPPPLPLLKEMVQISIPSPPLTPPLQPDILCDSFTSNTFSPSSLDFVSLSSSFSPLHLQHLVNEPSQQSECLMSLSSEPQELLSRYSESNVPLSRIVSSTGKQFKGFGKRRHRWELSSSEELPVDLSKSQPSQGDSVCEELAICNDIRDDISFNALKMKKKKKHVFKARVFPEVTRTIGIEIFGWIMNPVFERHTKLPSVQVLHLTTCNDYQTSVRIKAYKGEHHLTSYNVLLGELELTGLDSVQQGRVKIEVKCEIDVHGLLTLTAISQASGLSSNLTVQAVEDDLSEEEMEASVRSAEKTKPVVPLILGAVSILKASGQVGSWDVCLYEGQHFTFSEGGVANNLNISTGRISWTLETWEQLLKHHCELPETNSIYWELNEELGKLICVDFKKFCQILAENGLISLGHNAASEVRRLLANFLVLFRIYEALDSDRAFFNNTDLKNYLSIAESGEAYDGVPDEFNFLITKAARFCLYVNERHPLIYARLNLGRSWPEAASNLLSEGGTQGNRLA